MTSLPARGEIHVHVIPSPAADPAARRPAGRRALETAANCYAPHALVAFGEGRRPEIIGERLHVSLARADGLVLVAVATSREVGVDAEAVRPSPPRAVVAQFLTEQELLALDRAPAGERNVAFARAWVRKEAALKAVGVGLAVEPSLVEVGIGCVTAALVSVPERGEVTVSDVAVGGGYVAAVAARGAAGFTVRRVEGISAATPAARRPARAVPALRP